MNSMNIESLTAPSTPINVVRRANVVASTNVSRTFIVNISIILSLKYCNTLLLCSCFLVGYMLSARSIKNSPVASPPTLSINTNHPNHLCNGR